MKQRTPRRDTHTFSREAVSCPLTPPIGQASAPRAPRAPPPRPAPPLRGYPPAALRAPQTCLERGRQAGRRARLRSTPSPLCSFMIGTRPPETQPERREGSRACGRRGGRARLPQRTRRWLRSLGRAGAPARCPAPGRLRGIVLGPRRGKRPVPGPRARRERLAL